MTLAALTIGIYNIIFLLILNYTVYQNGLFLWLYFFIVPPLTGLIAYNYFKRIKLHKAMKRLQRMDLDEVLEKRKEAIRAIERIVVYEANNILSKN
jgi:hypothetical protein